MSRPEVSLIGGSKGIPEVWEVLVEVVTRRSDHRLRVHWYPIYLQIFTRECCDVCRTLTCHLSSKDIVLVVENPTHLTIEDIENNSLFVAGSVVAGDCDACCLGCGVFGQPVFFIHDGIDVETGGAGLRWWHLAGVGKVDAEGDG